MNTNVKEVIVNEIREEIYKEFPYLWEKYGEHGWERTKEDNFHHLKYLETSFQLQDHSYFEEYALWLNNVLTSRGMSPAIIIDNFERLIRHLSKYMTIEEVPEYVSYLQGAIAILDKIDK
ncbi:hypothetical protein [Alkalihalobacillus pseudalcaliphilus]|uniref:hypothetical protein n=1 Tax=Alkalihalobacillus pseudalcaliphilus TaxID=79884 RepID=UPI00064D8F55|nr:hypothetical protein [Alkalihalobacillus pseudalcaliphilus]KMK75394.1 hypothetical protein AB990_08725 [Alkalihalobacillus pseudalcaliphilus]